MNDEFDVTISVFLSLKELYALQDPEFAERHPDRRSHLVSAHMKLEDAVDELERLEVKREQEET